MRQPLHPILAHKLSAPNVLAGDCGSTSRAKPNWFNPFRFGAMLHPVPPFPWREAITTMVVGLESWAKASELHCTFAESRSWLSTLQCPRKAQRARQSQTDPGASSPSSPSLKVMRLPCNPSLCCGTHWERRRAGRVLGLTGKSMRIQLRFGRSMQRLCDVHWGTTGGTS